MKMLYFIPQKNIKGIFMLFLALFTICILALFLVSKYYTRSYADGKTVSLSLSRNPSNDDQIEIETGFRITDINATEKIDDVVSRFRNLSYLVRFVSPPVTISDHPNFGRLIGAGAIPYFSSNNYEHLREIANKYYEKFTGRIILELTDHDALSKEQAELIKNSFPEAKLLSSDYLFWPREKVRDLAGAESPTAISYPTLDAVSFHTSPTGKGIFDDVKVVFDTFFDASADIAGESNIKIHWPNKAMNLAISDIGIGQMNNHSEVAREEARRFGILINAYFNYAQMRGNESRVSNQVPIRYAVAGDYNSLSENSKSILNFFVLMSKRKQKVTFPNTTTGNGNPWDSDVFPKTKPLVGIMTHTDTNGYMVIFANESENQTTLKLTSGEALVGYTAISNISGTRSFALSTGENDLPFSPFEVIAIYMQSSDTNVTPTQSPERTPTIADTTPPSEVTPTNTVYPTVTPTKTQNPTGIPTSSITKTPTPSMTPTITKTPTPPLTPIPTSIIASFCDPKGCGACGWRGTDNMCRDNGPMPNGTNCCYSTCINNSCKKVAGIGVDICYSDSSCTALTPIVKYVVVENREDKISSTPNVKKTPIVNSQMVTALPTITQVAPPVSGDWKRSAWFLLPAFIILGVAIVL
jgi:hypothetical protein